MTETLSMIGGLETIRIDDPAARLVVVMAHGFEMQPSDLSPFARSLGVPAVFLFPQAPLALPTRGRGWWHIDTAARAEAMARGPRDLAHEHPAGLAEARERFDAFWRSAEIIAGDRPLIVGGFSQGGMLTTDTLLRTARRADALVLLSTSRLAIDEWTPLASRLSGLPVLIGHGSADLDLAFSAGEALRAFYDAAGAQVTWVPHDGGHQIPLPVWRRLKKFLLGVDTLTRIPSVRS